MGERMKVAVTIVPTKIELQSREIPEISPNQLLVKFKYVGICGSDVHIYYGKHPFVGAECFPLVQGHEGVATVVKVGDSVTGYAAGDLVTIRPQIACGVCEMCLTGKPHICESLRVLGCQIDGFLAEYFAIDANLAIKLDHKDSVEAMALIEPLAVAVGGVRKLGSLAGKNILVFGAGVIGNLTAQVAKAGGAMEVAIADVSKYRLDLATETCGISKSILIPDVKSTEEAKAYGGYDYILECVGVEDTLRNAIMYSKKNAKIVVLGVFGQETKLPFALVQDKELKIEGSLMYEKEDYDAAIHYIRSGIINVQALIYDKVPFSSCPSVYDYIAAHKEQALKVLIDMEQ